MSIYVTFCTPNGAYREELAERKSCRSPWQPEGASLRVPCPLWRRQRATNSTNQHGSGDKGGAAGPWLSAADWSTVGPLQSTELTLHPSTPHHSTPSSSSSATLYFSLLRQRRGGKDRFTFFFLSLRVPPLHLALLWQHQAASPL